MKITLPTKEEIREAMVQASRATVKQKTGVDPTEDELNKIRDYYVNQGNEFIDENLNMLKSKCGQIEQETTAIPNDVSSIPVELALPNDIVTGMASVPNPLAVVEKLLQKTNSVLSRIAYVLVLIEEASRICNLLHIPVPSPLEEAQKIMNSSKSGLEKISIK